MTFSHFNRRLHLYLGLALLPWLLMYGLSSIPFAHNQFFQKRDEAKKIPLWTVRAERPLDRPVPQQPAALREFGRQLLQEFGIAQPNFGVYQPNKNTVNVFAFSFLKSTRIVYVIDQKKATVEDRRFRFDQFLTGLHNRGGFEQDGFLQKSWGVVVDVVCVSFILWIATGITLWWGVPSTRRWGWLALVSGAVSFAVFVAWL